MDEKSSQPDSEGKMSAGRVTLRVVLLLVLPLIALAIGGLLYLRGGRYVETDNAYVKADVIPISAEVSAAIVKVLVKENQFVSAGDVLFELRSTPYQLAVDEARARMGEIHAELSALRASYHEKKGSIELARKEFEFAQKELKRQRDLKGKNFVSESTLDDLEHNVEIAQQQLQVLNLDLQRIAASLGGDADTPLEQHPSYLSAKAKLQQMQIALSRTEVRAPINGIVSQLPSVGQYVHTGNTVAALVATELLWVEANFSEMDLTNVRPGQQVKVHIDTYPNYAWQGEVESISPATGAEFSILPAQNATGNWIKIAQRVPIRIALNNQQDAPPLRSGLSAVVAIDTEHRRQLFSPAASAQTAEASDATTATLVGSDSIVDSD